MGSVRRQGADPRGREQGQVRGGLCAGKDELQGGPLHALLHVAPLCPSRALCRATGEPASSAPPPPCSVTRLDPCTGHCVGPHSGDLAQCPPVNPVPAALRHLLMGPSDSVDRPGTEIKSERAQWDSCGRLESEFKPDRYFENLVEIIPLLFTFGVQSQILFSILT